MYVTRRLSLYKNSPQAAMDPPPEGPHSGYLLIADDEWEAEASCCWGLCIDGRIRKLPFPQNKILTVRYVQNHINFQTHHADRVLFLPVAGLPLSSNRYYVIRADGKYKGYVCTCSREENMGSCCFFNDVQDINPMPVLDEANIYQQVEIKVRSCGRFAAKSVSQEGFPPLFLRRKGWRAHVSSSQLYRPLEEAHGLDVSLRSGRPSFDFTISGKHSSVTVVGKWHCPFVFVKEEGLNVRDQMFITTFYEMTLEQLWEETNRDTKSTGNVVAINTSVRREVVRIFGEEREVDGTIANDGFLWFRDQKNGREKGVGLSMAVVERMKWEATRGGWEDGNERNVKVERVEEFKGIGGWSKYGCYMLVERFVLKRMDKSLVLTYDFRHTHVLQSKWE